MFLKRTDFFDEKPDRAPSKTPAPKEVAPDASADAPETVVPEPAAPTGSPARSREDAVNVRVKDGALADQLKALEARAKELGRADLAVEARLARGYLAQARFSVAVVGEFSRGKSTLVNALLGREAIPTGATPTTQAPIHVIGGARDAVLTVVGGQRRAYPLTEAGWDDLERDLGEQEIGSVVVHSTCPLLAGGDLELVDTPGVNSQLANDITYADRAIVSCDCAILAVSAVSPVSELERSLLEEHLVGRRVPRVMMVLTMLDLVAPEGRASVVEHVEQVARTVGGGCPLLLSQEGLLAGWEGRSGAAAIARQIVTWLDESGHRELKRRRAAAEAHAIAQSLCELCDTRLRTLDQSDEQRRKAAEQQRERAVRSAGVEWGKLEVELLDRCNQSFGRMRELARQRQGDLLERLSIELSHTGNPKDWYETDYPYRMKNELVAFGNTLENTLQKCYQRDVAWLNQQLETAYGTKVPPEASRIADRELFRQDLSVEDLGLEDMRRSRLISRVGTGALVVGGALVGMAFGGVPLPLTTIASTAGGVVSEVALHGRTEAQRRTLERALRRDVPGIYERCLSEVEQSVQDVYRATVADVRQAYESWAKAQRAAATQVPADKDADKLRTRTQAARDDLTRIIDATAPNRI